MCANLYKLSQQMNHFDYVMTPSELSQRSLNDMDSQFFSSYSSEFSFSQDTQSTGIYIGSNFNAENRKSSFSYRAKNALLKTRSSLKRKLTTRIFSKASSNQHVDFSDMTYSINKEVAHKKLSKIKKLLEKSLGLFKVRSRKEKDSKIIYKSAPVSIESSNFYETQIQHNTSIDYCCQLETNQILTAPSMCSSFDFISDRSISCMHSTPCSFSQRFSPIMLYHDENYRQSSLTIEEDNISTSSKISKNRVVWPWIENSFGATSSPTSISSLKFSSTRQIPANQLRYLDHINKIKKNIKIEVEIRSLREKLGRVKEKENSVNMTINKKRKLHHIFRLNLKKQLKEMKKSQKRIKSHKTLILDRAENSSNANFKCDFSECA